MNRPSLRETVGCSVNSSNLKSSDLKEGAIDRVASMARADALGSALWRIKVGGDMGALAPAAILLAHRVSHSDEFAHWGLTDHLKLLSMCKRVLNEWLQDKCTQCKGRGRTGMGKGKVISSSVDCACCAGSGRLPHFPEFSQTMLHGLDGLTEYGPISFEAREFIASRTQPCPDCSGLGKVQSEKSIKEASLGKLCGRCEGSGRARINGAERARIVGVSPKNYWKSWDARFLEIRMLLAKADLGAVEVIREALRGPREEVV